MPKVEAKIVPQESVKTQTPPAEPRVDERLMKPGKYEITDQCTFVVDLHLVLKEGRWLIANGPGRGIESHKITFRMWGYDEMVGLRKMATSYDPVKRIHLTDNDVLNQLKVQKLLVSWTFDRDNPRLRLFHVGGTLTDESWGAFKKLQTNISSQIIDEMNKVLEYNG